jgi:hypothetical protein
VLRKMTGATACCRPLPEASSEQRAAARRLAGERDLPTAFVQDMLQTDPVHALGLRVIRATEATLEFVSLGEAKMELRTPLLRRLLNSCHLCLCALCIATVLFA